MGEDQAQWEAAPAGAGERPVRFVQADVAGRREAAPLRTRFPQEAAALRRARLADAVAQIDRDRQAHGKRRQAMARLAPGRASASEAQA